MRRLLEAAVVSLSLLSIAKAEGDVHGYVRERLGEPAVVRGHFEQTKHVAELSKPLVSSGEFVTARAKGVLWRTREPFAQTLILTANETRQEQEGEVQSRRSAEEEPMLRDVNRILLSLFAADFAGLEKHFRITGEVQDGRWRMVLVPESGALTRAFREFRMEGADQVTRVEILAGNGDQTEIRFFEVKKATELTDDERRALD